MTSESENNETTRAVRACLVAVAIVGAVGVGLAWGVADSRAAAAVAIGAALAVGNLWVLALLVKAWLHPSASPAGWAVLAVLKLGVLFGGMYWLATAGVVEAVPLFAGYGALPLGIVAAQLGPARPRESEG